MSVLIYESGELAMHKAQLAPLSNLHLLFKSQLPFLRSKHQR